MKTQQTHSHWMGPVFLAALAWSALPAHASSPLYDWQTRQVAGRMEAALVDLGADPAPVVKHEDQHAIDSPTDPNYYPVCRPDFTNPGFFPECTFTQTNPYYFPFCQFTDPMWFPGCDLPTNPAWWADCQTNPQWDPYCQPTHPQYDPLCMDTNPVFHPWCVTLPQYDPQCPPTHPAWDPLCPPTNPVWDPLCPPTDPVWDPLCRLTNPSWDPLCITDPIYDPFCHTGGTDDRPGQFRLEQNHPNPFNPSTRIGFTLPETGPVLLTVHDLAGRRVATLVDGPLAAGSHQVTLDGTRLAAGVYLYTLQAGPLQASRKLVLLK